MGRVSLNGHTILTDGAVVERAVNPWIPKITSGPKDFGTYAACEVKSYSDLRGGLCMEREDADSDRLTASYGLETSKKGWIVLAPADVNDPENTINCTNKLFCDFEGYTFLLGNSVSRYYDGTNWEIADTSPLATPTDAITIKDTTDNYLCVCNGADIRYTTLGFDSSPTALYAGELTWTDASGGDVTCSASATPTPVVGSASAKNIVADGAGVENLCYYDTGTLDITSKTHISMWIYSTVALAANDFQLILATNTALGGTTEAENIPAVAATTWTRVLITIATPASFASLDSIGIKQAVDKGALTFYIDQVEAISSTTAAWSVLSSSNVSYMAGFDKRLVGVDSTGSTLFYSAQNNIDDAATAAMSSFSLTGPWTTAYDLFTGLMPVTNDPMIFMLCDRGCVAIDFYTQQCELMDVRYPKPYTGTDLFGMYYNGEIYISYGEGIKKVAASGIVTEWGPNQDDGLGGYGFLASGTVYSQPLITGMIHTNDWVIISTYGDNGVQLFKRHNTVGGWHQIWRQGSVAKSVVFHSNNTSPSRIWVAPVGNFYFWYIPFYEDTNSLVAASYSPYPSGGVLLLPKFCAVETIPKIAVACKAITKNLTANDYITVYYGVNDAQPNTSLGTFTTSPYPTVLTFASGAGVAFYNIRFKLIFTYSAAYPTLLSFVFEYVTNPSYIGQWSFNLSTAGQDVKEIVTWLTDARDATTLVKFSPVGDVNRESYYVKVLQVPSKYEADTPFPNKQLTVVVSEVY